MRALRIIIAQSKAHYRKEETVDNKMTYPLPPFSTVIGAIHRACNFREYHPMDLSIQGTYSSLIKQPYTDYCFLDRIEGDRGILVKMKNQNLFNSGFEIVAKSKKTTGNNFIKKITIDIVNEVLLDEYISLKKIEEEIEKFKKERIYKVLSLVKLRKKSLTQKKKKIDKNSVEYKVYVERGKEIEELEKKIDGKFKEFEKFNFTDKISFYQALTTSLKYYEVLHDVKLIIHITSEEEGLLETIQDNIYNLKALGRSEDFVSVEECEIVNLRNIEKDEEIISPIPGYVNTENIKNGDIFLNKNKDGILASGTKYYLGKVYNKDEGFRDFEKKVKVLYTTKYMADEDSKNIYVDETDKWNTLRDSDNSNKSEKAIKFLVQFS